MVMLEYGVSVNDLLIPWFHWCPLSYLVLLTDEYNLLLSLPSSLLFCSIPWNGRGCFTGYISPPLYSPRILTNHRIDTAPLNNNSNRCCCFLLVSIPSMYFTLRFDKEIIATLEIKYISIFSQQIRFKRKINIFYCL